MKTTIQELLDTELLQVKKDSAVWNSFIEEGGSEKKCLQQLWTAHDEYDGEVEVSGANNLTLSIMDEFMALTAPPENFVPYEPKFDDVALILKDKDLLSPTDIKHVEVRQWNPERNTELYHVVAIDNLDAEHVLFSTDSRAVNDYSENRNCLTLKQAKGMVEIIESLMASDNPNYGYVHFQVAEKSLGNWVLVHFKHVVK